MERTARPARTVAQKRPQARRAPPAAGHQAKPASLALPRRWTPQEQKAELERRVRPVVAARIAGLPLDAATAELVTDRIAAEAARRTVESSLALPLTDEGLVALAEGASFRAGFEADAFERQLTRAAPLLAKCLLETTVQDFARADRSTSEAEHARSRTRELASFAERLRDVVEDSWPIDRPIRADREFFDTIFPLWEAGVAEVREAWRGIVKRAVSLPATLSAKNCAKGIPDAFLPSLPAALAKLKSVPRTQRRPDLLARYHVAKAWGFFAEDPSLSTVRDLYDKAKVELEARPRGYSTPESVELHVFGEQLIVTSYSDGNSLSECVRRPLHFLSK